jgi:hypothetical protein
VSNKVYDTEQKNSLRIIFQEDQQIATWLAWRKIEPAFVAGVPAGEIIPVHVQSPPNNDATRPNK